MQWRTPVTAGSRPGAPLARGFGRGVVNKLMGLLAAGGLMLGMAEACGTATGTARDAGPDVSPQCLTSITENGSKCDAPETLLCYAAINCTPTPQQANCVCKSGKWDCSYSELDGGTIAAGSTPKCFNEIDAAPGVCPGGEPTTAVACDQPGLVCTYKGDTCPDAGEPNTDTCQCAPSDSITVYDGSIVSGGDGGLVWSCDRQLCNPTSDAMIPPPPDSGMIDSPTDSPIESGKDAKSGG